MNGDGASVAMVRRPGTDQIVMVFGSQTMSSMTTVSSMTFTGGAWTTPMPIAMDGWQSNPPRGSMFSLAALADGRVALAYPTSSSAIKVGFFDGSSWSAFQTVPGAMIGGYFGPVSIARGVDTDLLELVYVDATNHVQHMRLIDAASWAWSSPVMVGDTSVHTRVALAAGP
jgi:hypothetical protein